MRLAFLNRNPLTHPGGDVIMLQRLMTALREKGVECKNIYGEWGPERLHEFDAVVIYHCQLTWSRENWQKTLQSRRPYVVLPIFYPTDQLGMGYEEIRQMLDGAQAVVPLSFKEARELGDLTGFRGPLYVIPHGTEDRFSWHQSMLNRQYVMCANARGDKGESLVEKVCQRLGYPFRYVKGEPHEKLHLLYRQAKVFVHSSPDDRMSLTVGEALCSGCRVLSSLYDRGNEWFPHVKVIDPANEEELFHWIRCAWETENWDWRPNEAARLLTWGLAAERWLGVFKRILS